MAVGFYLDGTLNYAWTGGFRNLTNKLGNRQVGRCQIFGLKTQFLQRNSENFRNLIPGEIEYSLNGVEAYYSMDIYTFQKFRSVVGRTDDNKSLPYSDRLYLCVEWPKPMIKTNYYECYFLNINKANEYALVEPIQLSEPKPQLGHQKI